MYAFDEPGHSSDILDAALSYAGRGWSVVPVHSPVGEGCSCGRSDCTAIGKHPRVRWEAAMHEPATVETVVGWWERWPDANVGIVTGMVSGVVVLDVDPRHDGDHTHGELESAWGPLPVTAVDITGGGGWHYWFAATGDLIPSIELGPGLDVKGEGGLAVAPPSRHASGRRYRWLVPPTSLGLTPAPPWLPSLVHGAPLAARAHRVAEVPRRTTAEQEDFAAAWARVGIDLLPGDRYYRCPFHDDRHPSLHVDREGCRWFCFGCGRGGGTGTLRSLLGDDPTASRRRPSRRRPYGWPIGPRLAITLSGHRTVQVVGESRHQDALLAICGGRRHYEGIELETVAELVTHPGNAYDSNTIEVRIDGLTVGYLGRDDVAELYSLVVESVARDGMATCPAVIRGGWDRGGGDVGRYGVTLRLPRGG
jgi:hypothetical protein